MDQLCGWSFWQRFGDAVIWVAVMSSFALVAESIAFLTICLATGGEG